MERIGQHMRNILAINFGGNPIPEGIDKYLKEQIAFINKMTGILYIWELSIANPPKGEEKYWKYVHLMMKQIEGMVDG